MSLFLWSQSPLVTKHRVLLLNHRN